jgi:hypothetical protein
MAYLYVTVWEDLESIRAFAGERWQEAVITPAEKHLLKGALIGHYEVLPTPNEIPGLRWRLRRLPAAAGAVGPGLSAVGRVGAVGLRLLCLKRLEEVMNPGRPVRRVQRYGAPWRPRLDGRSPVLAGSCPYPGPTSHRGWDERTILTTFLDYVRATVHAKCEDLAEPTPATPRCPPPR